jgi:hypothetical protein
VVAAATALVATLAGPAAYAVSTAATPSTGSIPSAGPATAGPRGGPGGMPGAPPGTTPGGTTGGMGGLLNGSTSSAQVTALLQADADAFTWTAAAIGANNAAGYQLASEEPVMAIGGFNGSDPSPTLAQFRSYVADGQVHWFIAGGGMGGGPGGGSNGTSQQITEWVQANFEATTVDGVTLYDLSGGIQ